MPNDDTPSTTSAAVKNNYTINKFNSSRQRMFTIDSKGRVRVRVRVILRQSIILRRAKTFGAMPYNPDSVLK